MTVRVAYTEYLKSPYWKAIRRRALIRTGGQCERCGRNSDLQVHHKTYDRLGCEQPDDLEVLCDPCHHQEHSLPAPIPTVTHGPELLGSILQRLGNARQ